MMKIGYIGLGLMGKPMAANIIKAGFDLIVYNRSRAAMDELIDQGASPAKDVADLVSQADVVITNLPDSPDVEGVALGQNGILAYGKPGLIFIDHSTIKPTIAEKMYHALKTKSISSLDAPVSGGQIGAQQGTLTIMVGGDIQTLEKVMPIMQAEGRKITHVGSAGAGQVAKAANQIMVAAQMAGMAELLIFATKAGADPARVVEAIQAGAAQCWTLDQKPARLFAGNRQPGFKARMQLKDLNIVMESGREYGVPLPMTAQITQLFQSMIQMGMGELDNSALIGVYESMSGAKLKLK